jgi:hypothetical protein
VIAICVFQDQNPIGPPEDVFKFFRGCFATFGPRFRGRMAASFRVGEPFGDPDTTAVIEAERDWLHQVWLRREGVHSKPRRQSCLLAGVFRAQPGVGDDVRRRSIL